MSCTVPFLNLLVEFMSYLVYVVSQLNVEILEFHLLLHALAVQWMLVGEVNVRTDHLVG